MTDAELFQLAVIEPPERIPGLLVFAPSSKRSRNDGTKWMREPIRNVLNGGGARLLVPGESHQSIHCGG